MGEACGSAAIIAIGGEDGGRPEEADDEAVWACGSLLIIFFNLKTISLCGLQGGPVLHWPVERVLNMRPEGARAKTQAH